MPATAEKWSKPNLSTFVHILSTGDLWTNFGLFSLGFSRGSGSKVDLSTLSTGPMYYILNLYINIQNVIVDN